MGALRDIEIDAGTEVIDAGGRVVMPGFVDAHTHPVFAGNRADEFEKRAEGATYQEIAAAGGGIRSTVRTHAGGERSMIWSRPHRDTASGFCATAPRRLRRNRATVFRSKMN